MWNILIVILIVVIIWAFNPIARVNLKPSNQVDKKTQNEVNQVVDQAQQQVNYARQLQQKEQHTLDNN